MKRNRAMGRVDAVHPADHLPTHAPDGVSTPDGVSMKRRDFLLRGAAATAALVAGSAMLPRLAAASWTDAAMDPRTHVLPHSRTLPMRRASALTLSTPPAPDDTRELVFLVHGLGRTPISMYLLARRLEHAGYRVANWGYWSTTGTVQDLANALHARVGALAGAAPAVHFVGHSLGNIVIRCLLAHHDRHRPGRVVMLAPPNQGSTTADRYARWMGWLLPYLHELRTDTASTARTLRLPEGVDVGIIAGQRDGKVRVAETRLDGARDHTVVPATHTFLMNRPDVHRLIIGFLRDGAFARES